MERYNHQEVEKKWQEKWRADKLYEVEDTVAGKENYYQLTEFPYPSGNLHVGHWYAFCGPDIHARYMRMTGKNVLFPIGFDAFGLPAENAAIKRNLNPADWTEDNMAHMRTQIDSMGASFDRSREIATCRPDYYKHTQWLFNQLFTAGLVERKTTEANWCPSCKTVLANEQVVSGACERCDSEVIKKEMPQWQVKITNYADRLIDDLDGLDFPEEIKTAQRNWIGRSEGAEIEFPLVIASAATQFSAQKIKVFTTRPDTLFGVTYMVLAPEHVLVEKLKDEIKNVEEVNAYQKVAAKKSDIERQAEGKEKTGVKLEGITAINPANGEEIPVYIADYVLAHYGTGAIMAVPAHDERDFAFAEKYDIPVKDVVSPNITIKFEYPFPLIDNSLQKQLETYGVIWSQNGTHRILSLNVNQARKVDDLISDKLGVPRGLESNYCDAHILENYGCYLGRGELVNSCDFDGMASEEAKKAITEYVGGRLTKTYKLRDWGISRQRYWGCPIPLVHCEKCEQSTPVGDIAGAGALIETTNGTFLFQKRDKHAPTNAGKIALFGGQIEEGESLDDCLRREMKEELELDVVDATFIGDVRGHSAQTCDKHIRMSIVRNVDVSGLVLCEGEAMVEMSLDEALQHPGVTTFTKKVIKMFKSGKQVLNPGWFVVPDEQLPVELPVVEDYLPNDDGRSPLAKSADFIKATCPQCGGDATRETDTMDTFVDSSWYFLRYADAHNTARFADEEKLKNWMPVDFYSGGAEHTTMHLLYSRFFHKALYDLKLVSEPEPYKKRLNRGLILGTDGNKMSKSKGNTLEPDDIVEKLGADTLRLYLAFVGPYNETGNYPWNPQSIIGVRRFVERVWKLQEKVMDSMTDTGVDKTLHKTLKQVTESITDFKLNTGVAALMSCVNALEKSASLTQAQLGLFAQMLAPYAPHIAEELWKTSGGDDSVHVSTWPQVDESLLVEDEITIAVQINGKVRDEIVVAAKISEEDVKVAACASSKAQKYLADAQPKKIIYVKGRLVNIVV